MKNGEIYSNWLEVDLDAIGKNIQLINNITGVKVMAIVKANAYGHGVVPVAHAAVRSGATWFGVARYEEAIEIRMGGVESPILILGFTSPGVFDQAIANQVSLTVWDIDQVNRASAAALRLGRDARVHLKVDTGMSRLGIQPQHVCALAEVIAKTPGIYFEGIFTHFARADESDPDPSNQQEALFDEVLESLSAAGICPPLIHAANSAATLRRPASRHNLVRTGIAMYGLNPSPECQLPAGFRPALSWKTVISQLKTLPAGRGVSYGHEYFTRTNERIGTLPVGYADGFRRIAGNQVLISGRRVPIIGRVCMDQVSVQVDAVQEAKEGDEVVIIGNQGEASITTEDIAQVWGTVNYEVICGIGARVPRLYV